MHRLLPPWLGELRDWTTVRRDLAAGVTVALVAIPQAMAVSQLAGLPPHYGLYSAFIPPIVAVFFGSSRRLVTGPVAIISLMTATALQSFPGLDAPTWISCAIILALMVGVIQLLLGFCRLGALVNLLAHPVIVGFTSAAAIVIAGSELENALGVAAPHHDWFLFTLYETVLQAFEGVHLPTVGMTCFSLAMIILMSRFAPRLPVLLVTVIGATTLSWAGGFEEAGGSVVGLIPQGLPRPTLPRVDPSLLLKLVPAALAIALLGFAEAISIAKAMALQTRRRLDPNRELVGQGLANLVGGVFQCFPVSGSFTRSAVNLRSGASTGLSSMTSGFMVAFLLLFFTPLLYHLPRATLSAVIMAAVIGLVRLHPIQHAWKVHYHDGAVATATLIVNLVAAPRFDIGILVGILLAVGLYVLRTMRPKAAELGRHPDGTLRDAEVHDLPVCESITMVRFDGSLYFVSTSYFENKVLQRIADKPDLRFLIIVAGGINRIDSTGEQSLRNLVRRLRSGGVTVLFAGMKNRPLKLLRRSGLYGELGNERFFRTGERALRYAWKQLGADHEKHCPLSRGQRSGTAPRTPDAKKMRQQSPAPPDQPSHG